MSNLLERVKKYDCPIKFTITDCEAGWTDMICDFNGTVLNFRISDLSKHTPSSLLKALLSFNILDDDFRDYISIKTKKCNGVLDTEGTEWDDVILKTKIEWDEEPLLDEWSFELNRKDFGKDNFLLKVKILRIHVENVEYNFNLMYRDLCYAIAKCFTDFLKRNGFLQYRQGTYCDEIIVRHLLIIKGYALGILSNFVSLEHSDPNGRYNLTFEEEIELLKMDM